MGFQMVPNSVTLNDLERHNSHSYVLFHRILVAFGAHYVKVIH